MIGRWLRNGYLAGVYAFLYIPLCVVVAFSFNVSQHSLLWHGFSWRWYAALFQDSDLLTSLGHSFLLASLASSIATVIGSIAAISLFRYRFRAKKSLHHLLLVLIVLPDLVLGIALLMLYRISHFPLGFWSLLLAHITFCLPFAAVTVLGRLNGLNKHLLEAGRDLGASEAVLYRQILLPLIWPSLLAAWLLSFTLSLDDVVISYFVSGPDFTILPLQIFSMVKLGVSPEVNALSSLLLMLTLCIVMSSQYLLRRR